jgi:hypothetical protein
MKIHSDKITPNAIYAAAHEAGVEVLSCEAAGSRKREAAFMVYLSGSSRYVTQYDHYSKAATWDEWGIFLASLYRRDTEMVAGQYLDKAHFQLVTREQRDRNRNLPEQFQRPDMNAPWLDGLLAVVSRDPSRSMS